MSRHWRRLDLLSRPVTVEGHRDGVTDAMSSIAIDAAKNLGSTPTDRAELLPYDNR